MIMINIFKKRVKPIIDYQKNLSTVFKRLTIIMFDVSLMKRLPVTPTITSK